MTVIQYRIVPGFLKTGSKKKPGKIQTWRLVDTRTGKTRAEMTNPADVACVIEAITLADLMKQNCARVGIFEPEMIERYSFED